MIAGAETDMNQTTHDREKLRQLSHATIEQAVVGIFWLDAKGRIHRANLAACRLFGYGEKEILGLTIPDLDPDFSQSYYKRYWKDVQTKGEVTFEALPKRKDGTRLPVEVTSYYVNFGESGYTCTFVRDITLRKRSEEKLRETLAELRQLKDRLQEENLYLKKEIEVEHNFREILGRSPSFKKVLAQIELVATSEATVLILGETGTGKELIARAVHDLSNRKDQPLVKVNCAALPENLIESELFGHEKGAFTGALSMRTGRFELADGGTIFLDEIGDLSRELQVKLLRVLQECEFERVGSPKTIKVDVRVIAATNRNLEMLMRDGSFREDLFYRLNVFPLHLPPLRERREDIPLLVSHFVEKYGSKIGKKIESVPQKAMNELKAYHWPGNIRELENIIERAVIISRGGRLELGDWLLREGAQSRALALTTLEENERQHILKALELTGWRVSGEKGAAKLLDINPKTLQSRMSRLGIRRTYRSS